MLMNARGEFVLIFNKFFCRSQARMIQNKATRSKENNCLFVT